MLGSDLEALAVERPESPNCRFAQVHRLLKYGVKDRREVAERGIDDLHHLRDCGLLVFGIGEVTLQRVAFGSARSQLRFKLAYGPQCIDQSCFALVRHLPFNKGWNDGAGNPPNPVVPPGVGQAPPESRQG